MRTLIAALVLMLAASSWLTAKAQVVKTPMVVAAQRTLQQRAEQSAPAPAVSIVVRADFVLFTVSLETGTRSADARKDELTKTFKSLTDRAAKEKGVSIEAGEPGASAPVETASAAELIKSRGQDRSGIFVVVKIAVQSKDTFEQVRARAEKFIKETPLAGRVEAVIGDDQYLGVEDPSKHREDLLKAIAADTRLMGDTFRSSLRDGPTAPIAVSITGLETRVESRPSGPLEVEIYIPYQMSLRAGAPG